MMKKLMTRHFAKWAKDRKVSEETLKKALDEVESGNFEADLGGHIIKKADRFCRKRKKRKRTDYYLLQKKRKSLFYSRLFQKRKFRYYGKGIESVQIIGENSAFFI